MKSTMCVACGGKGTASNGMQCHACKGKPNLATPLVPLRNNPKPKTVTRPRYRPSTLKTRKPA